MLMQLHISLVTYAGIAAGVVSAFSRVCLFVHTNWKTAWAINAKLGTSILYSIR